MNESKKFVFSNSRGEVLKKNVLLRELNRAKQIAGVDRGNLHSFRHTFATKLLRKGMNLKVVKDLLGHDKIETTEIYTHINVSEFLPIMNLSLDFKID